MVFQVNHIIFYSSMHQILRCNWIHSLQYKKNHWCRPERLCFWFSFRDDLQQSTNFCLINITKTNLETSWFSLTSLCWLIMSKVHCNITRSLNSKDLFFTRNKNIKGGFMTSQRRHRKIVTLRVPCYIAKCWYGGVCPTEFGRFECGVFWWIWYHLMDMQRRPTAFSVAIGLRSGLYRG